jgi:2-keto-4-pentenoate hydratase/2-oxohepta-3-ene-1,7-dioic acid hydratase in catechol pathway
MPNEENAMRFVSYVVDGHASWGALTQEDHIVDLKARGFGETLRAAIAAERLGEARAAIEMAKPDHALGDVKLTLPLPDAGKVLAVGANYSAHAAEMSRDVGSDPQFFLRLPGSLVPHGAPIVKPRVSDHLDYEGELAVIIGKRGRHIPLESAMAHVAGYSCFNDGTIRDYQKVSLPVGKNFEASGSMGPWMVAADAVSFPLELETRVNGDRRQHDSTANMTFAIPRLIEYASRFVTLEPGDIIASGTPSGVGMRRDPPCWLAEGDRLDIEISGVGLLSNPIRNEAA